MTTPHILPQANRLKPMRELTIYHNKQIVKRLLLTKRVISLGRSRHCDITLLERTISNLHALILTDEEFSYIEDQNSTNGIYVNGTKIERCQLKDGDRICMGRFQLTFTYKPLHVNSGDLED